jgi:hypothetical protein
MNVGLIDADLVDSPKRRFPNLALMKIAGYHRQREDSVVLLLDYSNLNYDRVYISKVFTDTPVPPEVLQLPNVQYGGTGFFYDKAPSLPDEIEHSKPDYTLYDNWLATQTPCRALQYFKDFSIGHTTRGCIRQCKFCVNRNKKQVCLHSPILEFYDSKRPKLCLMDDNIFAYGKWEDIFSTLVKTCKGRQLRFEFKQGMDIRLMTDKKAEYLKNSRYCGKYIFAFDNIHDAEQIKKGLAAFRKHIHVEAKCYVLCAYENQDAVDIYATFKRIAILWRYRVLAYIMRFEAYKTAPEPYRSMYIQLARWCNQPNFQYKLSLREFCELSKGKALRELNRFEEMHPDFSIWLNKKYQK